ncbi:MAG: PAS domain S-box-containing protein [Flavobacterium sp.]|jgi:PAS domain S-box-containing protein
MDFSAYDKAAAKYYSGLDIKTMPLISWDFFSQSFSNKQLTILDNSVLSKLETKNNWETTWDFTNMLQNETVIVVTDSKLKIVFASENINKMNGYNPKEVIGQTPKMFQGKDTDAAISNEIRLAIENQKPFDKVVLNYRKDGSVYKCHIKGHPIFNHNGKLINFIAFEKIAA